MKTPAAVENSSISFLIPITVSGMLHPFLVNIGSDAINPLIKALSTSDDQTGIDPCYPGVHG